MKKYFIHDGRQQLGPFSAMELVAKGISRCTPVYTAGLGRYVTAAEIPMLNDAFAAVTGPAAIGAASGDSKNGTRHNPSFIKKVSWLVLILAVLIIPIVVYKYQRGIPDAPLPASAATAPVKEDVQLLKTVLAQKEAANPLQYLTVHGRMHKNLLGKKIIKGSISNLASVATYKQVQLAVIFLSATETVLQTQEVIVNDFVKPNDKISFRSVFAAPEATAGFSIKVLSAQTAP